MPSLIVPGDIVKYHGTACYTGNSYTLHALVISVDVEGLHLQALPLSPSDRLSSSDPNPSEESGATPTGSMEFDACRDLSPADCTVISHVTLPPAFDPDTMSPDSFSSKDQAILLLWCAS